MKALERKEGDVFHSTPQGELSPEHFIYLVHWVAAGRDLICRLGERRAEVCRIYSWCAQFACTLQQNGWKKWQFEVQAPVGGFRLYQVFVYPTSSSKLQRVDPSQACHSSACRTRSCTRPLAGMRSEYQKNRLMRRLKAWRENTSSS